MPTKLFARFREAILAEQISQVTKGASGPLPPDLLLERDGTLSIYYAPCDYTNPEARVVLLGITPGCTQASNAIQAVRAAMASGFTGEEAMRRAMRSAGFSGKMRPALVKMLDAVGLQRHLGIATSGELFETKADWLQSASAIVFPVFKDGKDYNGTPEMTGHPMLARYLTSHLAPLIETLSHAIFIPLGPKPSAALEWVARQHGLRPARVLHGMPHPSGANAERIAYFLGEKPREKLSAKTNPDKLDQAKREIIRLLHI